MWWIQGEGSAPHMATRALRKHTWAHTPLPLFLHTKVAGSLSSAGRCRQGSGWAGRLPRGEELTCSHSLRSGTRSSATVRDNGDDGDGEIFGAGFVILEGVTGSESKEEKGRGERRRDRF